MAGRKVNHPPNAILAFIAALVTVAAIGNVISALQTDSVWILEGSGAFSRGFGTTPKQVLRSADPVTFYVTLVATTALAVYMDYDLWRRYKSNK